MSAIPTAPATSPGQSLVDRIADLPGVIGVDAERSVADTVGTPDPKTGKPYKTSLVVSYDFTFKIEDSPQGEAVLAYMRTLANGIPINHDEEAETWIT